MIYLSITIYKKIIFLTYITFLILFLRNKKNKMRSTPPDRESHELQQDYQVRGIAFQHSNKICIKHYLFIYFIISRLI